MPRPNILTDALRDVIDAVQHHAVTLVHAAFDLVCVMAVGAFVYATGLDPVALPGPDFPARIVKACPVADLNCITATVLAPMDA